jgi:hypothetical protein
MPKGESINIHLFRSEELSPGRFNEIVTLITQFAGPGNFISGEETISWEKERVSQELREGEDIYLKKTFTVKNKMLFESSFHNFEPRMVFSLEWDTIFSQCETYRKALKIPASDLVIILTDHSNNRNWFSAWDPAGKRNFFVHTGMWEHFIEADPRYPVVYELAAILLWVNTFSNHSELIKYAHDEPRGCVCDMCMNKKQVSFKLRTADICPECRELLVSRNVNPEIVKQFFDITGSIRQHMLFRENYKLLKVPSRMEVDQPALRLNFPDLGKTFVKLSSVQMKIYRLFLNHPEGFSFADLIGDDALKNELKSFYSVSNKEQILLANSKSEYERLIYNLDDTLSQHISRIKKKISDTLGVELAEHYIIRGEVAMARKIHIDRSLVSIKK